MSVIIGTAGHIDHGKTTLIKYLTGIDADRLPEEKEKGMTIDIGFSFLEKEGKKIGIVDVPGHEKFIKNMLTGVSGIEYIIFVIACDDGIMPQTVEHFNILKFLEIKNGIIVLTKKDLVTEEKIKELKKSIREIFKNSFMDNLPILETSIDDIKSFEKLKEKIFFDVEKIKNKNLDKNFLMYIDRSFSPKGFGTVVTGSIGEGKINKDEFLYIYPQKTKIKIKNIEQHGERLDYIEKNNRCALNISGVDYKDIKRGDFLYSENNLKSTEIINVYLSLIEGNKIKPNQKIRIYVGTSEIIGKIRVLEELSKNNFLCEIILEKENYFFQNQLGIMRNYSPLVTLGGIKILKVFGKKVRKKTIEYGEYIEELKNTLLGLENKNKEINIDKILNFLLDYHKKNYLEKGIDTKELKKFFSNKIENIQEIIDELTLLEKIKVIQGKISLIDFKIKLTKDDKKIKEEIFSIYKNARFLPYKYEIIEESLIKKGYQLNNIKSIHKYMVEENMLEYLGENRFILSGYFKESMKLLKEYFESEENKEKGITLGEFRQLINTNRDIAILLINKLEKINFLVNRKNIRYIKGE